MRREGVAGIARSIASRYRDAGAVDAFLRETLGEGSVVLQLVPERVTTWIGGA